MSNQSGVSSAHPLATQVGLDILQKGGNAVDASVGVAFALGVVEPYASGIGGGGNMLIFPENGSRPILYDYRETAPSHLNRDYNIGLPGFVKGMERIVEDQGKLSLAEILEPVIRLAEEGFEVSDIIAGNIKDTVHEQVHQLEHFWPQGQPLQAGERLIQTELAHIMKELARQGSKYFYEGEFAQAMVAADIGITAEDLRDYEVKLREPLHGYYHDYEIWSAPAPVSGSVIILTLALLERLKIDQYDSNSPEYMAHLSRVLKTVLKEVLQKVGDPDFIDIDEDAFLSEENIQQLAEKVSEEETYPKSYLEDNSHTTHFSVVDKNGMVVSTTNTLSNFFGSGVYVKGVFFNNQMQNFSEEEGMANSLQVGKRCVSIIAPSILTKDGQPVMAIGASGAARIPTIITKAIVDYIQGKKSIADAIAGKRFFVSEDEVFCEDKQDEAFAAKLAEYGLNYTYFPEPMFYGGVQGIVREEDGLKGAADPRRGGRFKGI